MHSVTMPNRLCNFAGATSPYALCDYTQQVVLFSQELQAISTLKSCALSSALNEQGLESCILFAGSGVIEVDHHGR